TFGLSHDWRSLRRRVRTRGNLRLACCYLVATRGIAKRVRVSWLTDAARRYHSENATLFFDGADRRGLGGEPIAGSLLAARRGGSRFQSGSSSGADAGR